MKKKTKRKAREWDVRVMGDGDAYIVDCGYRLTYPRYNYIRVREILPRKRAAKKRGKR